MAAVKVEKSKIYEMMERALDLRGIRGEDAKFIIEDYLESEIEGHKTHGLSKFLMIDIGLSKREGQCEIILEKGPFAKVDGHKEQGHIAARAAAVKAAELAKSNGIGIVALTNYSRYARVTPYARLIAEEGLLAIVSNNGGGPVCTAPFGAAKPLLGTNPIAFGFPGEKTPYVFDFATSDKVWGVVRQSIIEGKPLPENAFLDKQGELTTDPHAADAAIAFGGPKGSALCIALEVLTGAFIGEKMGKNAEDEYDLGALFVALSPEIFTTTEGFRKSLEALADDVRTCPPRKGFSKVRMPGDGSASRRTSDELELEEDIYQRLEKMSQSLEGGYEESREMN